MATKQLLKNLVSNLNFAQTNVTKLNKTRDKILKAKSVEGLFNLETQVRRQIIHLHDAADFTENNLIDLIKEVEVDLKRAQVKAAEKKDAALKAKLAKKPMAVIAKSEKKLVKAANTLTKAQTKFEETKAVHQGTVSLAGTIAQETAQAKVQAAPFPFPKAKEVKKASKKASKKATKTAKNEAAKALEPTVAKPASKKPANVKKKRAQAAAAAIPPMAVRTVDSSDGSAI